MDAFTVVLAKRLLSSAMRYLWPELWGFSPEEITREQRVGSGEVTYAVSYRHTEDGGRIPLRISFNDPIGDGTDSLQIRIERPGANYDSGWVAFNPLQAFNASTLPPTR